VTTRLTRDDIIGWANTSAARGLLPQLIHRLITASGAKVDRLTMPFGDSVGRSGLDGFVIASTKSSIVPKGESVWEMGVDRAPKTKANKDYKKRNKSTTSSRKKKTTYLQVTPRHWEHKEQWITDLAKHGWKNVIVYDVDDLLGFLDQYTAVDAWFARLIGKPSAGLRDCEGYWNNLSMASDFSIKPRVLLAGRDKLAAKVQRYSETAGESQPFSLCSRSPMEVLSFSVASICSTNDQKLLSRSVVIDQRYQWERVIVEENDLILVLSHPVQPTTEELLQAKGSGHKVIYAGHATSDELIRLDQFELEKALFDSGADDVTAAQLATRSRGSDIVLIDSLHRLDDPVGTPMSQLPDRVKAALLLIGGWDENCRGDQQIVEWLCGCTYDQILEELRADACDPAGMLFTADGKLRLLAPERDWRRFSGLITAQMVRDYRDLIELVLIDDDPTAELSGTDRWIAQFRGEKREFSESLRKYTIESLALAASLDRTSNRSGIDTAFCDSVVRTVFDQASVRRWLSLNRHLPMLAEASPKVVLEAIECGLQPDGAMHTLFAGGDRDSFSASPHTGVLWALERMAWSPQLLMRTCDILVRLDEICGDLKVANTPANSFVDTLSFALPQTAADRTSRRDVIQQLIQSSAGNAWFLIASLVPDSMRMMMVRSKPFWRDWAHGWSRQRRSPDLQSETLWLINQIINNVGDSLDRCIKVLSLYDQVPIKLYVKFVDDLRSRFPRLGWTDDQRRCIWEAINLITVRLDFLTRELAVADETCIDGTRPGKAPPKLTNSAHERYIQLKTGIYDGLVKLQTIARPSDPVLASVYAFRIGLGNKHFTHHFERSADYSQSERKVAEARMSHIREVFNHLGFEGICSLSSHPDVHSASVGFSAAKALGPTQLCAETLLPLFDSANDAMVDLANGFLQGSDIGIDDDAALPVANLLKTCDTNEKTVGVLLSLRNDPKTWDFVDDQTDVIVQEYWRRVQIAWSVPVEQVPRMVRLLIKSGRVLEAIDRLGHMVNREDWDWRGLIFECLGALTSPADESVPASTPGPNVRWELQQLFKFLYSEEPSDLDQLQALAGYEIAFSSLFGDDHSEYLQPLGFIRLCAIHPEVFVETIAMFAKSDANEYRFDPADEENQDRARRCHELLRSVVSFPGYGAAEELGGVNYCAAAWVEQVLEHANTEQFQCEVVDQLTEIFTRGAVAKIEDWPSDTLASAINLVDTEAGRSHLLRSLQNDRGMHCVDHSGNTNREIAARFRSRATVVQEYCPAAADAISGYATMLEREAERLVEESRWGRD
jgi:hypothetical protein